MRKQFDLDYYLAHPEVKVETRDGRDVRILCTDLQNPNYPIVASYANLSGNGNDIESFTSEGKLIANSSLEHSRDLFFSLTEPEKKKVPLTYGDLLERAKNGKPMWLINDRDIIFNIIDFDFGHVYYIYGAAKEIIPDSYEDLMNGTTFLNGDPTWKEVDE